MNGCKRTGCSPNGMNLCSSKVCQCCISHLRFHQTSLPVFRNSLLACDAPSLPPPPPPLCRPYAERGAGAGEAVPGGEAHGPGGAAGDVRARAGVPTAAAVSRENAAIVAPPPPRRWRPPGAPRGARSPQQAPTVDRGAVGADVPALKSPLLRSVMTHTAV